MFGERMQPIFYDGTGQLVKILVSAPFLYAAVILFIRIAGKRSTSQMNNFDWIVTVAMGSLVGSGLILMDIQLAEALLAIFALMALQYLATWLALHVKPFENALKAEPRLLVRDGEFLHDAMRKERVTEAEIMAALRESGVHSLDRVRFVILESDAKFSVIADKGPAGAPGSALVDVPGISRQAQTGAG